MNIFLFNKKPTNAFTIDQLQGIYTNLQNLGYPHSLKDFLADLATYCRSHGVDVNLTDLTAAPYISNRILMHLENLTQAGLHSKIFALCGENKKAQMELKIPTLYVRRQEAIEVAGEIAPQLEPLLQNLPDGPEWIPGFAPPIHESLDIRRMTPDLNPREENVSEVIYSSKPLAVKSKLSEEAETIMIPAKIAISVSVGKTNYEIPLFLNTQDSGTLQTKKFLGDGKILTKDKRLLAMSEYAETYESYTQSISSVPSETFPHFTI